MRKRDNDLRRAIRVIENAGDGGANNGKGEILALNDVGGPETEELFSSIRNAGGLMRYAKSAGVSTADVAKRILDNPRAIAFLFEVIAESFGNLLRASRELGWKRWELAGLVEKSHILEAAITEGKELLVDVAEDKLAELVQQNGPQAITPTLFLLKTRGRGRGWYEKAMRLTLENLSVEQLRRLAEGEDPDEVVNDDQAKMSFMYG